MSEPAQHIWIITRDHMHRLLSHAQEALPHEACGLLAGHHLPNATQIMHIMPVHNAASQPQTAFYMDERELLQALKQIDADGLSLVGIYHSHPRNAAQPSPTDIAAARQHYPDLPQLIIGHAQPTRFKTKPDVQVWRIGQTQIERVALLVSDQPVATITNALAAQEQSPLTRPQRAAIVIAVMVAILMLLGLSIMLLPPAPIITPAP